MIGALVGGWRRGFAALGRLSMYRVVLLALGALAVISLGLSLGSLVVPSPLELLVSAAVLSAVCVGGDMVAHRILRRGPRAESSLITAGILLFVLRPSVEPMGLLGLALAGLAAVASKYLLAWRGRHVFNPAAVGATVVTIVSALLPLDSGIGASAWWVGSPYLLVPVVLLGLVVLVRAQKTMVAGVFVVAALAVGYIRSVLQLQAAGLGVDHVGVLWQLISASPVMFLAAFMLSEPLTLPPRRWQQLLVAAVVGAGVGWPILVGAITLGQERALLIGNLLAFALCRRGGLRLRLVEARRATPSVRELVFEAERPQRFMAGQYLELEVPHRGADARGTRREFSIVSAPADLPLVRLAYRDDARAPSTFKRALADVEPGGRLWATGVWGDFVLPRDPALPVLLIAGGIGITPFISQLRQLSVRDTAPRMARPPRMARRPRMTRRQPVTQRPRMTSCWSTSRGGARRSRCARSSKRRRRRWARACTSWCAAVRAMPSPPPGAASRGGSTARPWRRRFRTWIGATRTCRDRPDWSPSWPRRCRARARSPRTRSLATDSLWGECQRAQLVLFR